MARLRGRDLQCPLCGLGAELVGADLVYPHRPDLAHIKVWRCAGCKGTRTGCHPGTIHPLGALADFATRAARRRAHAAFDPLWKGKGRGKRRRAYGWLAEQLGIPTHECHIAWFGREQCERVVALSLERRAELERLALVAPASPPGGCE